MKIVKDNVSYEIIIEKSRFITNVFKICSLDEIDLNINLIKKKYYDASHHPYAYIFGNQMKSSDDSEPSRTAGLPILEVLKKNDLTDVLCIVTRYFGGIKLGTSGLFRAYSNATSECIKKAQFQEKMEMDLWEIIIDYPKIDLINNFLKKDTIILKTEYLEKITLLVATKDPNFLKNMHDLLQGKDSLKFLEKTFINY